MTSTPGDTYDLEIDLTGSTETIEQFSHIHEFIPVARVFDKCKWCGQWGLISTPCLKCGGPIDGKL